MHNLMKMNRWLRIVATNCLFTIILVESSSLLLFKTSILRDIYKERGLLSEQALDNQGISWRNELSKWGAWHIPNSSSQHVTDCFQATYKSNNIGARDSLDYTISSPSPRILLLGDSFAEGYTVNEEETAAKFLSNLTKLPVLNFGTAFDFGPLQYYLLYSELAAKYDHSELIIFFLPMNDFVDNDPASMAYSWIGNSRYRPYQKIDKNGKYLYFYPPQAMPRRSFLESKKENGIGGYWNNLLRISNRIATVRLLKSLRYRIKSPLTTAKEQSKVVSKSQTSSTSLMERSTLEVTQAAWFSTPFNQQKAALYWLSLLIEKASSIDRVKRITLLAIPSLHDISYMTKRELDPETPYWVRSLRESELTNSKLEFINGLRYMPTQRSSQLSLFQSCDPHWSPKGNKWAADLISNFRESNPKFQSQ